MKIGAIILSGLLIMVLGPLCFAEESAGPMTKLGTGLHNMFTGVMEVPYHMHEVGRDKDAFAGLTYGMFKGVLYGAGRTVAGGIDTATFPVPPYDKPLMEPRQY